MDIVFWSGGKDSLLTLLHLARTNTSPVTLLTTFNAETQTVPFQNIAISTIRNQAAMLNLPLITVALPPRAPNDIYVQNVHTALQNTGAEHLYFGDWSLDDIKEWREHQFDPLGYTCHFPIWEIPFSTLMNRLEQLSVDITISYVEPIFENYVKVGEQYTRTLVEKLPDHIDPMGEHGAFHTCVKPETLPKYRHLHVK